MEEIDVLWQVGNAKEWWPAEVIDINTEQSARSTPSLATIRYKAKGKFNAVDYTVSFVDATRGRKLLKHLSPEVSGPVHWKFSDETMLVSDNAKQRPRISAASTRSHSIPDQQRFSKSAANTGPILPGHPSRDGKGKGDGNEVTSVGITEPPVLTHPSQTNTLTGIATVNVNADQARQTQVNNVVAPNSDVLPVQEQPNLYVYRIPRLRVSNRRYIHTN